MLIHAPRTKTPSPEVVDLTAEEAAPEAERLRHLEASRRGGLKGGRVRAARLSPERRSEIARKAARARWARRDEGST